MYLTKQFHPLYSTSVVRTVFYYLIEISIHIFIFEWNLFHFTAESFIYLIYLFFRPYFHVFYYYYDFLLFIFNIFFALFSEKVYKFSNVFCLKQMIW